MAALSLVVGLLAGIYPALSLSAAEPVKALKGTAWNLRQGGFLRNGLVVFQFALSTALIVIAATAYDQSQYLGAKKLGFAQDQVVVLPAGVLSTATYQPLRHELELGFYKVLDFPARTSSGLLPTISLYTCGSVAPSVTTITTRLRWSRPSC